MFSKGRKGSIVIILMLLISIVFASSCSNQAPASAPAPKEAAKEAPKQATQTSNTNGASTAAGEIKVGGSLPLTGVFSESAQYIKQGYEYWASDVNSRGGLLGRKVKLIIYDDESSTDKAVTNYERAITVDKVDLLLGGYPGTANVAVMPLAEKYHMVFIGMGGHLKSFEQGLTYSFASPPLMSEWEGLALKQVIEAIPADQRPKTLAIASMNNVIGLAGRDSFNAEAKTLGIQVVMDETYNLPLTDATAIVAKAKEKNADIFFSNSMFDDGLMTMRAMKSLKYNPKMIFQTVGSVLPAWAKELGPDGDHVLSFAWWHPAFKYPYVDQINQAAKDKYNAPVAPQYFGLGFSWAKTLELAVEGAKTLDQAKIRDYLRNNSFDLPYGKGIRFDKRGLPPEFVGVTQTEDGKIKLLFPKDVATTKLVYPRPNWQ